jgi:hypothetical protein
MRSTRRHPLAERAAFDVLTAEVYSASVRCVGASAPRVKPASGDGFSRHATWLRACSCIENISVQYSAGCSLVLEKDRHAALSNAFRVPRHDIAIAHVMNWP